MLLVLALLENDSVLLLGTRVVNALDRLEVREAAAEISLFFPRSSAPCPCRVERASAAVRWAHLASCGWAARKIEVGVGW